MLSLCVVARNEARFIKACIESARPVVDEAIVVDTGSTDGTPDVARDAGARVVRRKWPGNLGRAHDLPLAYASGSWILSLDADEVLDPASRDAVRRLVDGGRADGYYTAVRNYVYGPVEGGEWVDAREPLAWGASSYIPTSVVRLFRRRAAYRYEGCLHQSIAPAIRRSGGRLAQSDLLIHHYGLLRSDRDKSAFYVSLARRQVAARPRDASAWIELGMAFTHAPFALEAFRRAHGLGQPAAASFMVGATLIALSQPRHALSYLRAAIRRSEGRPSPYFSAADAFEQLAAAHDALGQSRQAIRACERALRSRPKSAGAMNDLAAMLAEHGAWRRAAPLIERLKECHPGLDATWVTIGTALLGRGDAEGAVRALSTALEINPLNVTAQINLGAAHEAAGHPRRARRARADAWQCRAGAGIDRLNLQQIAGRRPALSTIGRMSAGGVVSVIDHLHGGAGRVLVDVVRALGDRPHLVVCGAAGAYTRLGLREELENLGIDVRSVASREELEDAVRQSRPEWVVHHWWPGGPLSSPGRVADERWIVVGHVAQPMPSGYDVYVTLSDFHERLQPHVPRGRLRRIANGVDLHRFSTKRRRQRSPLTIAMLSRLEPSKFPRRLLASLPPLRAIGARLLIAGGGGRRLEIEADVAQAGHEDIIRFVGPLRSAQIPDFLGAADIGLHLTEAHQEVCSMTILEMLAAGLPIVAQPKGSLAEQIEEGINGYLAESEDQVADRLAELARDPQLRRRMGAASRQTAARYRIELFRRSWRELLTSTTSVASPAQPRLAGRGRRTSRESTSRVALTPWRPDRCYLVCRTPGSGSALLCDVLERAGLAGRPQRSLRRSSSLKTHVDSSDGRAWLAELFEEHSGPNGVFGAHVDQDELAWLELRLAGSRRGHISVRRLFDLAFPRLRVIRVRRGNLVEQAVSALQSEEDLRVPRGSPNGRGMFDRTRVEASLRQIEALETSWDRFFERTGIQPIDVRWEDLRDNGPRAVRALLGRLGIEVPRLAWMDELLTVSTEDPRISTLARHVEANSNG